MTNSEPKEQLDCNSNGTSIANREPPAKHAEAPKQLIPQLCNHFYHLGWASGKLPHLSSATSKCLPKQSGPRANTYLGAYIS